jgi:NAD(P)-dependent dehydrogenase (short-subunit alcohol dehydrogenase family)
MNLNGRTALITGGASGIGAALGRALTARGARVGLVDVDADRLAQVAEGIPGAVSAVADVRDGAAVDGAVEELAGRLGGLDVAVANAGIATGGPLRLVATESVEDTIDVNLLGVWRTARAALPFVLGRPDGYVLLVASAAALATTPGLGAYSASKAGVEALGKGLRTELAPHGVRVGVAYYMFLDTPMVRGGDEIAAFRDTKAQMPGPLSKTHPLEPAIEATVAGIERRARVVCYPRYIRAMIALRGVTDNPLTDRLMRRTILPMEEAFAAEAERIGPDAAARRPDQRRDAARS